jgi:hypothetical protein
MLVEDIASNNLTVERAYDGTVLAAHSGALDVYAYRTLTVVRGVNGTTAATHADATAISRYVPPEDVRNYVRAKAIHYLTQGRAGWTGQLGGGEAVIEARGALLRQLEECVVKNHKRRAYAAV